MAQTSNFNYFFSKYISYLKNGKALYGKKILEFKITISDTEYQKLSGLKKVITEMGLLIVFIKNDVENLVEENMRLKKQLIKYKKQAMSIQKITWWAQPDHPLDSSICSWPQHI